MELLPLDDESWNNYRSGYNRVVLDTPQWIAELIEGNFSESHWDYLWDELHHQGDVGEASYAVVPYLAKYAQESESSVWHIWGFTVAVELARQDNDNPGIPKEIELSYFHAIKLLAKLASDKEVWEDEPAPCMAACMMLAKKQPLFARAYIEMCGKETALDFLKEETGWEP